MTDLKTQLDTILQGAAFAPIPDRAFLRVTGPDATRWLNGMVTNNVKGLAAGEGNYNFLLNAQGRILGDCMIYREPGEGDPVYLLETDAGQIEAMHQLLDKFIIMDDVELGRGIHLRGEQPESSPQGIVVTGIGAGDALTRILEGRPGDAWVAPQPGSITYASLEGNSVYVLTQGKENVVTFEVWCASRAVYAELYRQLEFHGTPSLSTEEIEAYRVYSGVPRYGVDIRNTETAKDLPQETAQDHALNFNKGCYVGQEIVERIHSRGQVHRTFLQLALTGSLPEVLPAPLEANGKVVGEITSAVRVGEAMYALGYARREALDSGAELRYSGGTASPRSGK
jgi:folate-binding protein YgfZ